jgi:hypothetical protein
VRTTRGGKRRLVQVMGVARSAITSRGSRFRWENFIAGSFSMELGQDPQENYQWQKSTRGLPCLTWTNRGQCVVVSVEL